MTDLVSSALTIKSKVKRFIYYLEPKKKHQKVQAKIIAYEKPRFLPELEKKYKLFHYITNELLDCKNQFSFVPDVS